MSNGVNEVGGVKAGLEVYLYPSVRLDTLDAERYIMLFMTYRILALRSMKWVQIAKPHYTISVDGFERESGIPSNTIDLPVL